MTNTLDQDLLKGVPGGPELIAWFGGRVPRFHDAEIVELVLERTQSRCRLKVHAFVPTPELDAKGCFVCTKHVIVTFQLTDVCELELTGFNHQNAILGLSLSRQPNGNLLLELDPAYGLGGAIEAGSVEISLEPGIPHDSIYQSQITAVP